MFEKIFRMFGFIKRCPRCGWDLKEREIQRIDIETHIGECGTIPLFKHFCTNPECTYISKKHNNLGWEYK